MRFLVAIHHPVGFDGKVEEGPEVHKAIDDLNDEMVAAGVRLFVGGLQSPGTAKSVQKPVDGKIVVTDGPYLDTREYIGGFWVLQAESMEEALEWGRKAALACRTPVEVRPFF